MAWLYDILTSAVFLVAWPYFLYRFGLREFIQRLGLHIPTVRNAIWIHAASVGEVNSVKPLLTALRREYPDHPLVLTTMTRTGLEIARAVQPQVTTFLLPLDLGTIMRRVFRRLQPQALILVETELWPNLLHTAHACGIPTAMVSARLSERSLRRFSALSLFWRPLFRPIMAVGTQSEADRRRFLQLGFRDVRWTGNLKFDLTLPDYNRAELRREWGIAPDDFVVTWGSSRPGEEDILTRVHSELADRIPSLRWVVAPRHLQRLDEVKRIFTPIGFRAPEEPGETPVVLVQRMGVLNSAYALADVAIVGGSFFNFGGHNPLEPAFYGIPVLMGPDGRACRDSVNALKTGGGLEIETPSSLAEAVLRLYQHPDVRARRGAQAASTVRANQGAVENTLRLLKPIL